MQPTANTLLRYMLTGWAALTLAFIALHLIPGDAIEITLRQTAASPEAIAAQRAAYRLDKPLIVQYGAYLLKLVQADFGTSLTTHERVSAMISARIGATFALAGASLLAAIVIGIVLGSLAAPYPESNRVISFLSSSLITLSLATPIYWTATLMIYAATHQLAGLALPAGGTRGFTSLILPALVLGFSSGGGIARIVETTLRETYTQPFIQTARAKGLHPLRIFEHALRAGLPPILSIIALQAGFLMSGTVITEIIFTRRGIGSLLHQAVINQDYPVVQALVLLSALVYALTRGIAQFIERCADPRQKEGL